MPRRDAGRAPARAVPTARPRRWTLNGDFVALAPDGVARYARETTLALDALIGEQHPLTLGLDLDLVAPRRPSDVGGDLGLEHVRVRVVPEWDKPRLPQVWCQMQLPRHVPGGLVSFCNLAPVAISRHIVCIHDLHTRLMPDAYSFGFRWAHHLMLPVLGRRSRAVTTVSELSRQDLATYGIAPPDKVTVTYNGADHAARWDIDAATLPLPTARPFVLGFGRPQPYKNTQMFWRIADALDQRGVDIVLAGAMPAAVSDSYGTKPGNVHLLGRVADADLAKLMTHALCLMFPSRIEGFGLPAVEAMTRGCPVVASTAATLREVCADAALYADPDDPMQWLAAIDRLRTSEPFRRDQVDKALRRAARFTWRGIAETYLRLMAEIDGN